MANNLMKKLKSPEAFHTIIMVKKKSGRPTAV